MTARACLLAGVVTAFCLPAPAAAHRLDEYLQATRIAIDLDRVTLDLDLTPGAGMAAQVWSAIDTDRDGRIAGPEAAAYVERVMTGFSLSVDGRAAALTLSSSRFPERSAMADGVGTIRLTATADVPVATAGHHQLAWINNHRPQDSVYLVNALVPADDRIRITAQRRDVAQRGLTLAYDVTTGSATRRTRWLAGGLAMLGVLGFARRGRVSPV